MFGLQFECNEDEPINIKHVYTLNDKTVHNHATIGIMLATPATLYRCLRTQLENKFV